MPVLGKVERRRLLEVPSYDLGTDPGEEAWKWRRLTAGERDLPQYDHTKMLNTALYLFRFNPLASRSLKLIRDHVIGGGVKIVAASSEVQAHLDKFWDELPPKMDTFLPQMVFEISLFGEITIPVTVNRYNGDVELGYISPFSIDSIVLLKENLLITDKVILLTTVETQKDRVLSVVRKETDPNARLEPIDSKDESPPSTFKRRVGDCFYFAVNRVGDMTRGLSDLLSSADFVDCLDQMVFGSLERLVHETNWIWDIEMTGATPTQIKEEVQKLESKPPRPGGFNVHNEWVKWSPMPVGLEAKNIADEARLIRNYALGGMGIPVHFFTEPESAGRAIAEALAAPAYKSLNARQTEIQGFIREILEFVIDQKIIRNLLDENVERSFDIIMPKISLRDLQRTGGALNRIAAALDMAQKNDWIDKDLGGQVFLVLLEQLGLGVRLQPKREVEEKPEALTMLQRVPALHPGGAE